MTLNTSDSAAVSSSFRLCIRCHDLRQEPDFHLRGQKTKGLLCGDADVSLPYKIPEEAGDKYIHNIMIACRKDLHKYKNRTINYFCFFSVFAHISPCVL